MKPTAIVVKPAQLGPSHAGDEIVNRRAIAALSQEFEVHFVEVQPIGIAGRLKALASGLPLEITRFASPANQELVREATKRWAPKVVCFLNEVTFPSVPGAAGGSWGRVLYAHNVHSLIASTETSLFAKAFATSARRFEKRWFTGVEGALVCISMVDAEHLKATGVNTGKIAIAPPGPPPTSMLAAEAPLAPELVITGSYGWWRKRRDLKLFAKEPGDQLAYVSDPLAEELIVNAVKIAPDALDWGNAVRFGLITDRFVGGFKLKSLEYVARNCVVLSYADISRDFVGLPHADEFVRIVKNRAEVTSIIESMMSDGPGCVARFREFQAACITRYDWAKTMLPIIEVARSEAGLGKAPVTNA